MTKRRIHHVMDDISDTTFAENAAQGGLAVAPAVEEIEEAVEELEEKPRRTALYVGLAAAVVAGAAGYLYWRAHKDDVKEKVSDLLSLFS